MNAEIRRLHLFVDLNDGCNLKCVMCSPRKGLKEQQVMPLELFEGRIAPVFAYVDDFQMGCAYEPLMLPYLDQALGLMRRRMAAEKRGQLITNGTLLKADMASMLLESNVLSKIRISIDGATQPTYEEIRQGARFDKVMDNVARLCRLRSEGGHDVQVEFNYTVMRSNFAELPRLILLASKLGVDSVTTHKLAPFDLRTIDADFKQALQSPLQEAGSLARMLGIAFQAPVYHTEEEFAAWNRDRCLAPVNGFRLDPEGRLIPQCHAAQKQGVTWNLLVKDIEEFFESEQFRHYQSCIGYAHLAQCDPCLHFGGT